MVFLCSGIKEGNYYQEVKSAIKNYGIENIVNVDEAYQYVKENFTVEAMTERVTLLYKKVLGKAGYHKMRL